MSVLDDGPQDGPAPTAPKCSTTRRWGEGPAMWSLPVFFFWPGALNGASTNGKIFHFAAEDGDMRPVKLTQLNRYAHIGENLTRTTPMRSGTPKGNDD